MSVPMEHMAVAPGQGQGVMDQPAPLPAMGDNPVEERECRRWEEQIKAVRVADRIHLMSVKRWQRILAGEPDQPMDPSALPDGVGIGTKPPGANFIYSTFASALPLIYDRVADVMVSPARSTEDMQYELSRMFGRTANVVLKRMFVQEAELRKRMRALARSTMAASLGWVKMAYVRDYDTEPYMKMGGEDAQNELARLQSLIQRYDEITDPEQRASMAYEMKGLKESIFGQRDVLVDEGLVIDLLAPTDVVVSRDVGCIATGWRQAQWIAQGIWLSPDEAAARFELTESELRDCRRYGGAASGEDSENTTEDLTPTGGPVRADIVDGQEGAAGGAQGRVRAWEIWNRTGQQVLTVVEGLKRWARPPMRPERRPQSWYPFYPLAFNHIEHRRYPLCDVELLAALQAELHELRAKFMEHRNAVNPKSAVDSSQVSAADADKWTQAPPGTQVAIAGQGAGDRPIRDAFFVPEVPLPSPALYDSGSVQGDMRVVFGLGDAQKGGVAVAKTATEARQTEAATEGRMGERTDELVELETLMAGDALEILLQEVSLERVQQIAGASAVWPMMGRRAIFQLVSIQVIHEQAADRQQKQELWVQLAPMVREAALEIGQLRMMGLDMLAEPMIEILRELLRRYDDRIDIERFLPGGYLQAGQPLPPQLQDAAAASQAASNPQQLAMLQAFMAQRQGGMAPGPGGPPGGAQGGGGPVSGYNPAAGGIGTPPPSASNAPSGVT